jgi:hypothetical protein
LRRHGPYRLEPAAPLRVQDIGRTFGRFSPVWPIIHLPDLLPAQIPHFG